MQKTKLGISVGLMGALAYFGSLFGGYIVALLIFGYILLVEENPWLRKTAVKTLVLLVTFSIISYTIGLIPDFITFINTIFNVFKEHFSIPVVTSIISVITTALSIIKTILFLMLGVKALGQATLNIPVVDDIANKSME